MAESSDNIDNNNQKISRFKSLLDDLKRRFPKSFPQNQTLLVVSISEQTLYVLNNQELHKSYPVSTAEAGIGNLSGSFKTPLGIHRITEKFGDNAPLASIFKTRENTNLIADIIYDPNIRSKEDNITSRILWLEGLEDGFNKGLNSDGNNVDSFSRYIYIHGTDEEGLLGRPASHGCVRMANQDVVELFDNVKIGDLVAIVEE